MVFTEMITKFVAGQTTIEIGLAIALAIVLIVATISVWNWANKNMVDRFAYYNASRLPAVESIDRGSFGMLHGYTPSNLTMFSMDYQTGVPPIYGSGIYSDCSDIINAAYDELGAIMTQDVSPLESLIAQCMINISNYKSDLCSFTGVARRKGYWFYPYGGGDPIQIWQDWIYESVGSWLYGGESYMYSMHDLGNKFDQKVYNWQNPDPPYEFYQLFFFWPCCEGSAPSCSDLNCNPDHYTSEQIIEMFIEPGEDLEEDVKGYGEVINNIYVNQIEVIEPAAWDDYVDCLDIPEAYTCRQQCQVYFDNAQSYREQAFEKLEDYDLNNYIILKGQGESQRCQFMTCFDACMEGVPYEGPGEPEGYDDPVCIAECQTPEYDNYYAALVDWGTCVEQYPYNPEECEDEQNLTIQYYNIWIACYNGCIGNP